jgi:hypothetical protein
VFVDAVLGLSSVCGKSYSTTIVPCSGDFSIYVALRDGGPLSYMANTPDQDVDWIGFPILEIFPKGREITFLTFSRLISISHLNSRILLFINQCTRHTAS